MVGVSIKSCCPPTQGLASRQVIYPRCMILAAVQDVNVVRDGWDWFFGWAQVVGALALFVAIAEVARARRENAETRREAAAERVRQFEIEILREILADVDGGLLHEVGGYPHRLRKYARRIALLPQDDLPFWRTLMEMRWQGEVSEFTGFKEPWQAKSVEIGASAKERESLTDPAEIADWRAQHDRLAAEVAEVADTFHETVSTRLLRELIEAITTRVAAGQFEASRRTWYGWRRKPVGHVD